MKGDKAHILTIFYRKFQTDRHGQYIVMNPREPASTNTYSPRPSVPCSHPYLPGILEADRRNVISPIHIPLLPYLIFKK